MSRPSKARRVGSGAAPATRGTGQRWVVREDSVSVSARRLRGSMSVHDAAHQFCLLVLQLQEVDSHARGTFGLVPSLDPHDFGRPLDQDSGIGEGDPEIELGAEFPEGSGLDEHPAYREDRQLPLR